MKILALDTAFSACSVCLFDTNTKKNRYISQELERGHAEKLLPMIDTLIREASIDYHDIDCIAVVNGPGAFTGMRVGISTAKALALSLNKPLMGVNSFTAFYYTYLGQLNSEIDSQENIGVLLETKRDDYYFGMLNGAGDFVLKPECVDKHKVLSAIKQRKCFLIGDAVDRFIQEQNIEQNNIRVVYKIDHPNLEYLVHFFAENEMDLEKLSNNIAPLYLRNADITMPKPPDRFL